MFGLAVFGSPSLGFPTFVFSLLLALLLCKWIVDDDALLLDLVDTETSKKPRTDKGAEKGKKQPKTEPADLELVGKSAKGSGKGKSGAKGSSGKGGAGRKGALRQAVYNAWVAAGRPATTLEDGETILADDDA